MMSPYASLEEKIHNQLVKFFSVFDVYVMLPFREPKQARMLDVLREPYRVGVRNDWVPGSRNDQNRTFQSPCFRLTYVPAPGQDALHCVTEAVPHGLQSIA